MSTCTCGAPQRSLGAVLGVANPMSPPRRHNAVAALGGAVPVVRGREEALEAINERLRAAEHGCGSVVLVEARTGLGKSIVLDEAARNAVGFRVGRSRAFPSDDTVTMAPLLTALFGGNPPLIDPGLLGDEPALGSGAIDRLERALVTAARSRPLLVSIDDAQWLDEASADVTRQLADRLAGAPIIWILAFRPGSAAAQQFDGLEAERLTLMPLDDEHVAQMVADHVRAEPSAGLIELAALAGGDPSLIVDLVHGLADEGLLLIDDGRAELLDFRVPRRALEAAGRRFGRITPLGCRTAAVAAHLGSTFSFDHLAAMFDVPAAALLEPVAELVDNGVLADGGSHFAFHNHLIRDSASSLVSTTVRHALLRQAIEVLVGAGRSPIEPATQLANSTEAGDRLAVSSLIAASRALAAARPDVAAEINRRAIALTGPTDHERPGLVAETALLLHATGHPKEATKLVESALLDHIDAEGQAQMRLSVAKMYDTPTTSRITAGRVALAYSGLSATTRAQHLAQLVLNLAESGEPARANVLLPVAEEAVCSSWNTDAEAVLLIAKACLARLAGDFERALSLLEHVHCDQERGARDVMARCDTERAELLIALDRLDAADEIARQLGTVAARVGEAARARSWQRLVGRLQRLTGQISDADATLREHFPRESSLVTPAQAATLVDQMSIAVHLGDRARAKELALSAESVASGAVPELRRQVAWVLALHAMAEGDPGTARAALRNGADDELLPLTGDPFGCVVLARIGVACGDAELTQSAVDRVEHLHRRNPDVASIAAAAAHVGGLVHGSASHHERAAQLLTRVCRPIDRASALEDLGAQLAQQGEERRAVAAFDEALRLYTDAGATWDASRVRRRLRDRGVRRRLVKSARPATGWEGLTDSEIAVIRLIAQGLSNRAAASQLFVSPHTVSMHLRHVFTKLGINSRVELTRLAVQHGLAA